MYGELLMKKYIILLWFVCFPEILNAREITGRITPDDGISIREAPSSTCMKTSGRIRFLIQLVLILVVIFP